MKLRVEGNSIALFYPLFDLLFNILAEVKQPAALGLENRNPRSKILWGSEGAVENQKGFPAAAADGQTRTHTHTLLDRASDIILIVYIMYMILYISTTSCISKLIYVACMI